MKRLDGFLKARLQHMEPVLALRTDEGEGSDREN
jgi:hypothetical protein